MVEYGSNCITCKKVRELHGEDFCNKINCSKILCDEYYKILNELYKDEKK